MNADAKPFIPSSQPLTSAPQDNAIISEPSSTQVHQGRGDTKQNQKDKRGQRRRHHKHHTKRTNCKKTGSDQHTNGVGEGSSVTSPQPKHDEDHVGTNSNDGAAKRHLSRSTEQSNQSTIMTKHQKQTQQKQHRRRRRNNKNRNDTNVNLERKSMPQEMEDNGDNHPVEPDINDAHLQNDGRGQKQTINLSRRCRNRRHRKHKSKSSGPAKNETLQSARLIDTIEEDALSLNAASFPVLGGALSTTSAADMIDNCKDDTTMSWNDSSLASKLSSLELKRQQEEELRREIEQERAISTSDSSVRLTMLSSKSTHTITENDVEGGVDEAMNIPEANAEKDIDTVLYSTSSIVDLSSTPLTGIQSSITTTVIPNTKSKWSGSELSKMRQRWWEAVHAKRKRMDEEKQRQRQLEMSDAAKCSQQPENGGNADDSSSVGSLSSSSASSKSSSDDENPVHGVLHHDHMQPPSLSNPFDEAVLTSTKQNFIESTPKVPQHILDLERMCIESGHPLHCAIYNHALIASLHSSSQYDDSFNDNASGNSEKSNAEVVLQRLLTMHSSDDVRRWKSDRVALSELRGLEAKTVDYRESRVETLTDASTPLLSADVTSLTPLQLAIYWNLPNIIRLLYTATCTASLSSDKNKSEEEDEHGRTPLMLACELGHAACIQAVLCGSTPKLDRRERRNGNTAFHYAVDSPSSVMNCNMGSGSSNDEEDNCDGSHQAGCVEAIDMMLRYTPTNLQKRALMLTNKDGQNVFHVACTRANFGLVQRLLECHNLPGVKITKALDAKDRFGYTPFLAAVGANNSDIVMHLLTARFSGSTPNFSLWFAGCPLVVAASNNSVDMVRLLLDIGSCYDASSSSDVRSKVSGVDSEVNRALLETIYRLPDIEEDRSKTYEIIELLISQGSGNPHQNVTVRFGKPLTQGDRSKLLSYFPTEDTPLSAAVRFACPDAVQCMIETYSRALIESQSLRRNDPMLQSQPESYFQLLEEKEDDVVHSSVDAAIVTACFLLWQESSSLDKYYGKSALTLYKRGRMNLSSSRHLSQRALQWLEHCIYMHRLVPAPINRSNDNTMDGYSFEAPIVQFTIPTKKKRDVKVPYQDAGVNYMDHSYVLAGLPWFHPQQNGLCGWMKDALPLDVCTNQIDSHTLREDEFFLVVDGEKLLAHKSIISVRSAKLAAQIRFTEEQQPSTSLLEVHVDLPLLYAKMLMIHCYHGSIALGLRTCPLQQCNQLLEMALIAEEYLCPTLLLECEMRLLTQTSFYEKKNGIHCMCPHCSGRNVNRFDAVTCPIQLKCLEYAKSNTDSVEQHCQPVGIYTYKASSILSNQSGLITPQSALDILAVAQQLEQVSPGQQGFYAIKYVRSGDSDTTMTSPSFCEWSIDTEKDDSSGCIYTPFSIAKTVAVWVMLREFPAVIRSDSYLRQLGSEAGIDSLSHADNDDESILLLRTCLDELESSPFREKEEKRFRSGLP